jgi:hypothetical protein
MLEELLDDDEFCERAVWSRDVAPEGDFGLNHAKFSSGDIASRFMEAVKSSQSNRVCQMLGINTSDGKIRVATIHTATQAWVARAMSAVLTPLVKKLSFTRRILREQTVLLKRREETALAAGKYRLYSADFSKSTDPLSIPLVRHVLEQISRHVDVPSWFAEAIPSVIAEHEIEGRNLTTKCGALMGQGPAWSVLCILNAFCAEYRGATRGSYAVCGDDLLGLWTKAEIQNFRQNTRYFSLVLNEEKSYESWRYGVFCERFAIRDSPYTAYARPCIRIGEASGAKAVDGEKGRAVHDHLRKIAFGGRMRSNIAKVESPIRRLAARVLSRTAINVRIPGSLGDGGGGGGKATALTVLNYIRFGPVPLYKAEQLEELRHLRRRLRDIESDPAGIPVEDVLSRARCILENNRKIQTAASPEQKETLSRQEQCKLIKTRLRSTKSLMKLFKGPIGLLKHIISLSTRAITPVFPYIRLQPQLVRSIEIALRHRRPSLALSLARKSWHRKVRSLDAKMELDVILPNQPVRYSTKLVPAPWVWDSDTAL